MFVEGGKQTNLDTMRKWVIALRSGNYKQTKCQLYKDGAYCALGVLADVIKADLSADGHCCVDQYGMSIGYSPLTNVTDEFCFAPGLVYYWNDALNLTFAEIADRIETYLPG